MLAAKKSPFFEKVFAVYNRNLLKRRFHSFNISGLDNLINKDSHLPLLIYANHPSWWDGLLAFEISRAARIDSYIMMDEENLRRYFLFRLLGAFSVPKNSRHLVESILYSARLLTDNPRRGLWIFPQGKIVPNDFRPMRFFNGAARIVEKTGGCLTVPLGFRLEFTELYKPEIFVKIAEPELIEISNNFNSKKLTQSFCDRLVKVLDELRDDVLNQNTNHYHRFF